MADRPPMPDGLLAWNLPNVWLKPREKGFYLLSLVARRNLRLFRDLQNFARQGTGSEFLVDTHFFGAVRNLVIAQDARAARHFSSRHLPRSVSAAALVALICNCAASPLLRSGSISREAPESHPKLWPYFVILGIMTLILDPVFIRGRGGKIGLNHHPVSFVIGPALYFLGNGLLPGLDYYTQYSIGVSVAVSLCHGAIGGACRSCLRD